jgi:ABC-2 type transport system ATP-binding protein
LTKSYVKGQRAIADVSFQITPGRVVGLLGPNGAGKTTLLGMITGLVTPTCGEVYLFGHLVQPGAPVLSRLGMSLEQPAIIPHLTGMQMLQTTWAITGRPEADAHLATVCDLTGLDKALECKVSGYSLGMRQRLALAQAMLGLPDVLLLDEPANGLDPAQVRQLRKTLRDYAASGRTVVLSSHVLTEVEKICDDILVLRSGQLTLSSAMADIARPTVLRLDLGAAHDVELATASLTERGFTVCPAADGHIEVAVTDEKSITVVLRAVLETGCDISGIDSKNTFEKVYYVAVADD